MKLSDDRKKIVEEHIPLVRKVASKIYARLPDCDVDFEDLVQTGIIGLIKAIDKYNQDKAQFSTYAYIRIRGEILDFLRSMEVIPRTEKDRIMTEQAEEGVEIPVSNFAIMLSLDKAISEDEENVSFLETVISDSKTPEEEYSIKEIIEKINYYMDINFSETEKKVINMLYLEEREPKEISKVLGISLSRISQIKNSAIEKLKKFMYDIV